MSSPGTQIWLPLLLTSVAGLSTAIGGLLPFFVKDLKKTGLPFFLGLSAGVMIYVSFIEMLRAAIVNIGFTMANAAFFGGILSIMFIDFLIPQEYIEERIKLDSQDKKLMAAGIFTAIGIAIHNFPEGLAVFISCMDNTKLGISVAFAILIHNIPEGIAVAVPICCAIGSRKKAFVYSMLSGIAEPLGALAGILLLMPILTPFLLHFSLAFVAGIMVFISFDELLPLSFENSKSHISVLGIITGMLVMALSLYLI